MYQFCSRKILCWLCSSILSDSIVLFQRCDSCDWVKLSLCSLYRDIAPSLQLTVLSWAFATSSVNSLTIGSGTVDFRKSWTPVGPLIHIHWKDVFILDLEDDKTVSPQGLLNSCSEFSSADEVCLRCRTFLWSWCQGCILVLICCLHLCIKLFCMVKCLLYFAAQPYKQLIRK